MCKVLLVASLAICTIQASMLSAQEQAASSRQNYERLLQAADTARDQNRDDEAIQLYRRALSEQPDAEQPLWYVGTLLYEKEQYAEARDVLRHFMTIRNDAAAGWGLLGICEFQLREYPR